jgi:hypothetical protein
MPAKDEIPRIPSRASRTGLERMYRTPSRISAKSEVRLSSCGTCARRRSADNAPRIPTYETAFTMKHHPSFQSSMTTPARTGPMSREMLNRTELRAIALCRSSRSTRSGMNACRVGISNARARPVMSVSATRCQGTTQPRTVMMARTSAGTIDAPRDAIMSRRLSCRSASAPARGPSTSPGPVCAAARIPTAALDSVSRYISHDCAVNCIHIPMRDAA